VRILIADDDLVSKRILSLNLRKWGHEVIETQNGLEALEALLQEDAPRLAILDWMMPGLSGVDVCCELRRHAATASVYVILLTALDGKDNMVAGLEAEADDYLTKPFDPTELRLRVKTGGRTLELQAKLAERVKDLEVAIAARRQAEEELRNLSLTDDLTGLYNRRGFYTLAKHKAAIARRTGGDSLLIYADMDGLKRINDTLGHQQGSEAIARVADVLRRTFRESDIVSRLGGDEFAILASGTASGEMDDIADRLRENIDHENQRTKREYALSLSVGSLRIAPDTTLTIEELIGLADAEMYEDKRRNKSHDRRYDAAAKLAGNQISRQVGEHPNG
jgi:diguanylate cyclase (GGDEF)-like protein